MEILQQPEYVHVLINHLPLTGLFASLLFLGGSLLIRKRAAVLLSLVLVSLFAASAWPVSVYGEKGYDRVYSLADSEGDANLEHHRALAQSWIWLFYLTGAAGVTATVIGWRWPKRLTPMAAAVVVLAVSSLIAGATIAESGGKVRHPEFRNERPGVSEGSPAQQV